jgi:ribonuclease P protein component
VVVPRLSFGKERRIRRRSDFLRVQAIGQRASTAHFVLLVAAREPDARSVPSCSRVGFVVTKKVGNAVQRNRIKRVCRECFRMWPELIPDGIDLVVIARAGADELGLEGVRAEWERARPALLKRCAAVLERPAPKGQK